MQWKIKWSFDGQLCQKYSCQKLLKSDNSSLSYDQKRPGCFSGHGVKPAHSFFFAGGNGSYSFSVQRGVLYARDVC